MNLDGVVNSLSYDAKESENVQQAVACVVKKRKCDGDVTEVMVMQEAETWLGTRVEQ